MTKCDLLMISLFYGALWGVITSQRTEQKGNGVNLLDISCLHAAVAATNLYFYNYMLIKV